MIHLPQGTLALFVMAMAASPPLASGKAAIAAPAASYPATVLSVGDGDTPWGQQSSAYLMRRLPRGRKINIHPHTTDRCGRTVAEVISDINVNLVMVEDGQGIAYRRYLSGCDAKEYLDAELRASRHRYEVWQVQSGITRP